ncbi:MAG: hypothetical protein ACRD88_13540 [Terriglobia bacterium]
MVLKRQEMEAKLAAIEDRVALLSQVVDTLEDRFELKMEQWTDWLRVHRTLLEVMDREMTRVRGKEPGAPAE